MIAGSVCLHHAISRAPCVATKLRDKLHEKLQCNTAFTCMWRCSEISIQSEILHDRYMYTNKILNSATKKYYVYSIEIDETVMMISSPKEPGIYFIDIMVDSDYHMGTTGLI